MSSASVEESVPELGEQNPVRFGSPELRQAIDEIGRSTAASEREGQNPYAAMDIVRQSRLGALRVPLDEGGGGCTVRELFATLRKEQSPYTVIFITGHGDIPLAVSAIRKGAYDFLTKPFREGELLEKIRAAIAYHHSVKEQTQELSEIQARVNCCTPREYEVMRLLIRGLPNKGIAEALGISPRTVEIHRAHVMEKMQAGSLPDLVRMVSLLAIF